MNSQIVGLINFEPKALQKELNKILQLEFNTTYLDYVFGGWKNCVLWNGTGSHQDTTLKEYEGYSQPTELAKNLDYVNSIISNNFNLEFLKWLRVFVCQKGVLLPHRDYLEMKKGFTRLHAPLQTDLTCLHSEEDDVFHMRVGEIWFLDATKIHSACSLKYTARVSLCFDFVPEVAFEKLIKGYTNYTKSFLPEPCTIEREPLNEKDLKTIFALGNTVNEDNFDQILESLAKVHFIKQANAIAMYDWLVQITRISGNIKLMEKALLTKEFATQERHFGKQLIRLNKPK